MRKEKMSNIPKNDIDLIIGGKSFKLKGSENAEYFQKMANYINGKIDDIEGNKGFKFTHSETQAVLMYINITDDYFRAKQKIEQLQEELEQKNKELYDLKHEIVELEMRLEEKGK